MLNPILNDVIGPQGHDAQERANSLVCQITDGFLRGEETRDHNEVRPFEELLSQLLPRADLFTRAVVSHKLSQRRDLPRRIVDMMVRDDAAVAEPLVIHSNLLTTNDLSQLIERDDPILRLSLLKREDLTLAQRQALLLDIPLRRPLTLAELEPPEADTQRLIISIPRQQAASALVAKPQHDAPIVFSKPIEVLPHAKALMQNMIRAAVLRRPQDLGAIIAHELDIEPVIAQALLKDESGEALIATCRHLHISEDASVQVATLLYPALLRTGDGMRNLRRIYRAFTDESTLRIVTAWRALSHSKRQQHEPVHAPARDYRDTPATPATAPAHKQASNQ